MAISSGIEGTHKNKQKVYHRKYFLQSLPGRRRLTLCGVEDAVGLHVAHEAALGLAVMLQSTGLTEVVPAPVGGRRHRPGYRWAKSIKKALVAKERGVTW